MVLRSYRLFPSVPGPLSTRPPLLSAARMSDFLLLTNRISAILTCMGSKLDVWRGNLALMVLKTLERAGSLQGYGTARRTEGKSAGLLSVNYVGLHPALLKLAQGGFIASEWGVSDNNRKANYSQLTRSGQKQIEKPTQEWEQMRPILARFLIPAEGMA
jgi:PadR family transcriptional regulator PadR